MGEATVGLLVELWVKLHQKRYPRRSVGEATAEDVSEKNRG